MARPVLIIGAGISGLLLAQKLRREGISFRIFDRDADFTTRGVGWGLTLHWSLPALRELLPDHLVARIPEAYVDRAAVANGAITQFPFFDLSTGECKARSPRAPEYNRIRVTRQRLRALLATDIDIEWTKSFQQFIEHDDHVTVQFEDDSVAEGCLLVACDGGNSLIRSALFPDLKSHAIPIRLLGLRMSCTPQQIAPMRDIDPFFLQGTASENNSFMYLSILDAPGNNADSTDSYTCQVCVSWPHQPGFFGCPEAMDVPPSQAERHKLVEKLSATWADPFRSFLGNIGNDTEIKSLDVHDFPPPRGLRSEGRAVLMGDALHAMAMYRGEGANHAIVDVLDFARLVIPSLHGDSSSEDVRLAMDQYEDAVVERAGPAVLLSRRACMDAHDWGRINGGSPLLTRRDMFAKLDDENGHNLDS